jgi:hypothetical protein
MRAEQTPAPTVDELTQQIKALVRRSWQDYCRLGALLRQVKAQLTHGAWLTWLETESPFSVSSAERCMRAHDLANAYPALAAPEVQVDPSAVDLLTAKKTPTAVVRQVVREAQQGTPISQRWVQEALAKVRPPPTPKLSTVENITPAPAPLADLDARGAELPGVEATRATVQSINLPGGITIDVDDSPSVEERMRRSLHERPRQPGRLALRPEEWHLVRDAVQGFLDYEDELADALDGPLEATGVRPVYTADQRQTLRTILARMRDELDEAAGR